MMSFLGYTRVCSINAERLSDCIYRGYSTESYSEWTPALWNAAE
jgi:hypothetical protein